MKYVSSVHYIRIVVTGGASTEELNCALFMGEVAWAEIIKILKIGVSEDCVLDKKSGLRRNPQYQPVRAFGDKIVKRYIKSIFL